MIVPLDDLDRIMAVMSAAFDPEFGEAWSRRQVEDALMIGNCHYGLAFAGGDCAGFFLSRAGVDEEELLLIAVTPDQRCRGYGAQLLERFLEAARGRGAARALLEMRQGNPAEQLYLRRQFVQIGSRPDYYRGTNGVRIDALTFSCELGPFSQSNN
jgi:ribosomal-protein-alanine N-acetyltransferase